MTGRRARRSPRVPPAVVRLGVRQLGRRCLDPALPWPVQRARLDQLTRHSLLPRGTFYQGLAAGPMSVVAPVSGLVSTVLPVAVALAQGERPGAGVYAGALLCLVAIVLASSAGRAEGGTGLARRPGRLGRAIAYGTASGVSFGLFFVLIRNAGQSGAVWPVAAARIGELAIVLAAAAVLRPGLRRGAAGSVPLAAAGAGAIDVLANVCYVAATRTGMFGLAVVLASLYPGVTVLLARGVLGERLRWVQRAGLGLAALGILLVAA